MERISSDLTEPQIVALIENDPIGRNQEIADFISLIERVEGGYSFFLNAQWGDGKTVFVKQTSLVISALNENLEIAEEARFAIEQSGLISKVKLTEPHFPIYYNAWKNDSLGEPLQTLIATIALESGLYEQAEDGPVVKEAAFGIIDSLLKPFNLNICSDFRAALSGTKYLMEYEEREELHEKVGSLIEKAKEGNGNKLVLFIDELDRCSPAFALKLLEEVKFLFENESVILVFSTDVHQLANIVSGAYGHNLDGMKYLGRFYDRIIPLSKPTSSTYLQSRDVRENAQWLNTVVTDLANISALSMRETNCYLESLDETRSVVEKFSISVDMAKAFFCAGIVPIVMLLKLRNLSEYNAVVNFADSVPVLNYLDRSAEFKELCEATISSFSSDDRRCETYAEDAKSTIDDLCVVAFSSDRHSAKCLEANRRLRHHSNCIHELAQRLVKC